MARQNHSKSRNQRNPQRGSNSGGTRREQPKKDSASKRVNYDNARVSRVEKQINEDSRKYNANDASEYSRNPVLVEAAGRIPFAPILGANDAANRSVPGVMALMWVPNFGPGTRPIALNQAADSMYSKVVHANSRDYRYTAPDLFILTEAGMQVFSILGAAIRAFGSAKAYEESNLYMPDAILTAQGFNPIDFRQNLSQIWFDINNFIDQSKQIWIPNTFPLMEHWFRLNSHIYTDAEGNKSQIYIPVQNQYLTFSETAYKTGSSLLVIRKDGSVSNTATTNFRPGTNTYDWSVWKTVIQAMIDNLVNSEDRGIIYGDLLNAYGADSLYALPSIPSDFVVYPDYNMEFLMQIENTNFAQQVTAPVGLLQQEEDLYPVYQANATLSTGEDCPPITPILNYHSPNQPDPATVMVMTRNSIAGLEKVDAYTLGAGDITTGLTPSKSKGWVADCAGSEVFTSVKLYRYLYDVSPRRLYGVNITMSKLGNRLDDNAPHLMAFDWHPFTYSIIDETSNDSLTEIGKVEEAFGDYDNYTTISKEMLNKLHTVAMFSLFGIPQI